MPVQIKSYTFAKGLAGAGTVTFTGSYIPSAKENILLITDTVSGVIIYNAFDPKKGGTYVPGTGVLTLATDTSGLANTDNLHIKAEDDKLAYFRSLNLNSAAQAVKATGGYLWGWNITNLDINNMYVKFYDKAAAAVAPGVDVPVKTLFVPAGSTVFMEPVCREREFVTAISVRAVQDSLDTGTTAPATLPIIELKYV